MCCKGFFKRVAPFFLTFSLGLFIASFFVTIVAPSFQFKRGFNRHREYHRKLEFENQRLREENSLLKRQVADKRNSDLEMILDVPPPPIKNSYKSR
jgi:hypothetical protein